MKDKRYLNCKYLDAGMDGMLCSRNLCTCKEFNREKCSYYMPKNKSKDKEKLVEFEDIAKEMSKELCCYYDKQKRKCSNCFGIEEDCDLHCNFGYTLEKLAYANYRKLPKDSVVLTQEEYDNLRLGIQKAHNKGVKAGFDMTKFKEESIKRKASKETAEKILNKGKQLVEKWLSKDDEKVGFLFDFEEFIKQFGVEIKE